ncbi:MAG: hypothetical protein HKN07_03760 [Acidimicrobiia bacterium]|nr:hypothetical protein [Acidimicrobiia bacterium]
MDTSPPQSTLVDVAGTLVFMQGAVGVMSVVESGVATVAGFAPPTNLLLTAILTVVLFLFARGLRRRSVRSRMWTLRIESLLIVWATVDLALAVVLADSGLGLVATLTRLVVPIATFWLLRRPAARLEFGSLRREVELEEMTV